MSKNYEKAANSTYFSTIAHRISLSSNIFDCCQFLSNTFKSWSKSNSRDSKSNKHPILVAIDDGIVRIHKTNNIGARCECKYGARSPSVCEGLFWRCLHQNVWC